MASEDSEAFREAMRAETADRERERLARMSCCPQCGRSANGAEWDLLSHAQAMNAALRHVRWLAETAGDGGSVPAERILEALDRPYRFPLPDGGKVAAIHMRIVQGNDLIADLPEWPGPVPREGDYIFHPPSRPGGHEAIAGSVACVKWRTHDRTEGGGAFVMTAHPYVEVVLRS